MSVSNLSRGAKARSSVNNVSVIKCAKCTGNHYLAKCDQFLAQSMKQHRLSAHQFKCCFNCLRTDYQLKTCKSKGRCLHCRRMHHSLLHSEREANAKNLDSPPTLSTMNTAPAHTSNGAIALKPVASAAVQTVHVSQAREKSPQVLLATAWVHISTVEGRTFKLRALLDQGSTYSFISESLCQTMFTKRQRTNLKIHCFGEKFDGLAKSYVNLSLAP